MINELKRSVTFAAFGLFGLGFGPAGMAQDCGLQAARVADGVYISAQPDAAQLECLKKQGVKSIINSRLPSELENLGFDEAALSADLSLSYLNVPVGGQQWALSPQRLDAFVDAFVELEQPVLLHCRSGRRSAILMAGYLVREQGLTVPQAIEQVGGELSESAVMKLLP